MDITQELFKLQDIEYRDFTAKLNPTVDPETIIGIRVPAIRKLAKELVREDKENRKLRQKDGASDSKSELDAFLASLPHPYFDENMLHGLIIAELRDYERCLMEVERFLPYIDNWAVGDSMTPKLFQKHKAELLPVMKKWIQSPETYTSRYGIRILMTFYLDEDFETEYLDLPLAIETEEYYLRMMIAWFYATALAKQWDATIPIIEAGRLERWTHNKTIQKARESFRITAEQKEYLKSLKR